MATISVPLDANRTLAVNYVQHPIPIEGELTVTLRKFGGPAPVANVRVETDKGLAGYIYSDSQAVTTWVTRTIRLPSRSTWVKLTSETGAILVWAYPKYDGKAVTEVLEVSSFYQPRWADLTWAAFDWIKMKLPSPVVIF